MENKNLKTVLRRTTVVGISLAALIQGVKAVQRWRRRRALHENRVRARAKRDGALNDAQLLPEEESQVEILEMTAMQLAETINTKRITCTQAVSIAAHASRTVAVSTNAVTEYCFDDAIQLARSIDYGIKCGKVLPLAGVPISVGDSTNMKGYTSTCGLAARALILSNTDSILVTILKEAGAIPVVRSATPQALMLPETVSKLWGVCKNPWNMERTPGGSSGGEGALLASRASWIGIGSDIGGSLRIVGHFCGVVAFKPTPHRITRHGMARTDTGTGGQEGIVGVPGPMARSVDDCEMVMSLWLGLDSPLWTVDPYTPRVAWKPSVYRSGNGYIRVGFFDHDGWFKPAAACARAVHETVNSLRNSGIECVPFEPLDVPEIVRCYYALLSAEGNMRSLVESCDGEELHPIYGKLRLMSLLPTLARPVLTKLLRLRGWKRLAALLEVIGKKSAHEYLRWVAERKRLQALWFDAMQSQGLDAIVCPVLALPALRHGDGADLTPACSYSFLWNFLHWPAGVVPIGIVGSGEVEYEDDSVLASEPWLKAARRTCKDSAGLPVGVQIATLPFDDETCLRLMRIVEQSDIFHAAPKFPEE